MQPVLMIGDPEMLKHVMIRDVHINFIGLGLNLLLFDGLNLLLFDGLNL